MIENTRDGLKSITIMRITSDGKTNISPRREAFNTFCMKHVIYILALIVKQNLIEMFLFNFLVRFLWGRGELHFAPTNRQTAKK